MRPARTRCTRTWLPRVTVCCVPGGGGNGRWRWWFGRCGSVNMQGLEGLITSAARDTTSADRAAALKDNASGSQFTAGAPLIIGGQLMSIAKLQLAGFNNASDTEASVVHWLKVMQREGYLPE